MTIKKIISGGQTGADQAGLDVAIFFLYNLVKSIFHSLHIIIVINTQIYRGYN